MSRIRRCAVVASVLAGVAIPIVVGCSALKYQFCITNLTSFDLKAVNIVPEGSSSWGENQLANAPLVSGQEQDIPGWSPGTYWVRAIFDVVDPCGNSFCSTPSNVSGSIQESECELDEVLVYSFNLPEITTTNLCIDYGLLQGSTFKSPIACNEIYATAHFEI